VEQSVNTFAGVGVSAHCGSVIRGPVGIGGVWRAKGGVAVPDANDICRITVDLREINTNSLHALRLLLLAEVLRRFMEIFQQRQVCLVVLDQEAAAVATQGFGIRVPEVRATSPNEIATPRGGQPAFLLEPVRLRPRDDLGRVPRTVQIGAVKPPARCQDTLSSVLGEHEPAALRLVLLRFAPTCPAELSAARLRRAEETLQRWRYKVAMWADMPSAPPVRDVVGAARESLGAGLDTVTLLKDLHRLEIDPNFKSGSKFETFACLDRVLGLDLCHLVGKLRR
jgi:hypothetical protein